MLKRSSTPRNVRNRNPGNIEHGDDWEGLAPRQSDERFATFVDAEHGFRAMAKIYMTYARRGIVTLENIIAEWAPPWKLDEHGNYLLDAAGNKIPENDTPAYIAYVSEKLGIPSYDRIDPDDYTDLAWAMAIKEGHEYDYAVAARGVQLAFIPGYKYGQGMAA